MRSALAQQRLARQQVVLGLGHACQQGPADRGVITGGHPQPGVPVDDLGGPAHHGNVGKQRDDKARPYRRPDDADTTGLVKPTILRTRSRASRMILIRES